MLLTSTKNPIVQSAKALQTAKGRREQNAFLCDGEHMTGEALRACRKRFPPCLWRTASRSASRRCWRWRSRREARSMK